MTQAVWIEGSPDEGPARVVSRTASEVLEGPHPGETYFVVNTRSNQERRVLRACEYLGIRHYLPLRAVEELGTTEDRVPLFPGYMFASTDDGRREELHSMGSVIQMILVPKPASLLQELRQIEAALCTWRGIAPGPVLCEGQRVRVSRGPLEGIEGLVAYRRFRRRRERLVLNVTMLGRAATLEIDVHLLKPVAPDLATSSASIDS
jgi:hypothetical protein